MHKRKISLFAHSAPLTAKCASLIYSIMSTILFIHTGNEAEITREIKSLVLLIQDANTFNEVKYLQANGKP